MWTMRRNNRPGKKIILFWIQQVVDKDAPRGGVNPQPESRRGGASNQRTSQMPSRGSPPLNRKGS